MWICSQTEGREHYAIPRALHTQDKLKRLFTDYWAGPLTRMFGPQQLKDRYHQELQSASVVGFNPLFLTTRLLRNCLPGRFKTPYDYYLYAGSRYSRQVGTSLKKKTASLPGDFFFGYDTGFLEAAEMAKALGLHTILGQIDPSRKEYEIVLEEEKKFPGLSRYPLSIPDAYFNRRKQEWDLADLIVVNSPWSKQALVEQRVPEQRLRVIPLAYEGPVRNEALAPKNASGITVLFLGQVILRKGIQYLLEAAQHLKGEPVEFRVVGPLGINLGAWPDLPPHVKWVGSVPRSRVKAEYLAADVFVLPTLSDGFAITQIEAMSYGVPVIATSNCGEVVNHQQDGWIIPPRDGNALAKVIQEYLELSPGERQAFRNHAIQRSKQFSIQNLASHLLELERELKQN